MPLAKAVRTAFPFPAASMDKADAGHPPDFVSRCEGLRYCATNDESDSCGVFPDASFSDILLVTTSNAEAIASTANSSLDLKWLQNPPCVKPDSFITSATATF